MKILKSIWFWLLIAFTGGGMIYGQIALEPEVIPDNLKLKADKANILYNEAIDDKTMLYDYKSDIVVAKNVVKDSDNYSNRALISQNGNEKTEEFCMSDCFWYDDVNKNWKKIIVGATTTIDAFNEQTKVSLLDKLFGNQAMAADYNHDTADSHVLQMNAEATWADAYTAATAEAVVDISAGNIILHASTGYYVYRSDIVFATDDLPDGATVTGLTMDVPARGDTTADTDGVDIVCLNDTDNSNLNNPTADEDFNDFGTTSIGDRALADFVGAGAYVTITMTDYDVVNLTGDTQVGMRLSNDIAGAGGTPTGNNRLRLDIAGIGQFVLSVTYTEGGGAVAPVIQTPIIFQ